MTLNQIFDTVQYGEEYTKNKILKENISKHYDKDLDIFYASRRVKDLVGKMALTEMEESKVNRLISKLVVVEDRLEDGKLMSEAYRKMQSSMLIEDCENLMEEVTKTKKADNRKIEAFAKAIADTKYFIENTLDAKSVLKESTNPLFTKFYNEEKKSIDSILA